MSRNNWSEEELILTLSVYFQLPFGRLNRTTPEVIELASLLDNRTANSAAMRLCNFAACDPAIAGTVGPAGTIRSGLVGGMSTCKPIWDKYSNDKEQLFLKAAQIRADRLHKSVEETLSENSQKSLKGLHGETRKQMVNLRVNQDAFRNMILNNYENKCAITGIDIPELLVASHIIPWADREDTRLDPENGICLSPLYDKAFDRGYIGVKKDYTIVLSSNLSKKIHKTYFQKYFQPLDGLSIALPYDHKPNKDYLEYHLDMIFEKHKSIV